MVFGSLVGDAGFGNQALSYGWGMMCKALGVLDVPSGLIRLVRFVFTRDCFQSAGPSLLALPFQPPAPL